MSSITTIFSTILASTSTMPAGWEFLDPIVSVLKSVLVPLMILVGTAGMIYAIVLGVNLARADTTEKREEAKKRMINAIIGLVSIIALILLLTIFVNNIDTWLGSVEDIDTDTDVIISNLLTLKS